LGNGERHLDVLLDDQHPAAGLVGDVPNDRRLVERSAQLMIALFAASPGRASGGVASRTWAYSILGAFQMVTVMWLDDDYCELDTLAADLTRLLWPGIERLGKSPG